MRHRLLLACGALIVSLIPAHAKRVFYERPTTFDGKIAELAKKHNVPERLIHRVIMRESRYVPHAVHAGNYGLMQIRLGTARTMGYGGGAEGLRDAVTNLTYAVPYLANAYAVAGHDEDRAVRLYASGFYYVAKRQGALARLQTAKAGRGEPDEVVAYASAPANPIAALFGALSAPAEAAVAAADAERRVNAAQMVAANEAASQTADDEETESVPLPPRRPKAFSTRRFQQIASRQEEREIRSELRRDESN